MKGALEYLISFAEKNQENKPVAYFTNGELLLKNSYKQFQDFDAFMRNLGYWSSWSAGIAIWRSDLEKIDFKKPYSSTFPHTAFLFSNTKAECYIIDDRRLVTEIQSKSIKKGKYNLFTAFSVEYIDILKGLLDDKRISFATFEYIKKDMSYFLSILLYEYIIKKQESSYDLQNYKEAIGKNYSYLAIVCNIPYVLFKNKFLKRIKKCMVMLPYVYVTCVETIISVPATIALQPIKAVGRSDLMLKFEIIKKVFFIVSTIVAMNFGVFAIALTVPANTLLDLIINANINKKLINYSFFEELSDCLAALILSLIMAVVVAFIGKIEFNIYIKVVIQIMVGGLCYAGLSYLTRNKEFSYILNVGMKHFKKA